MLLDKYYTDLSSSCFSNFIIGNKKYWNIWKDYALKYLGYINLSDQSKSVDATLYRRKKSVKMSVFIQERLSSLILSKTQISTAFCTYPSLNESGIFLNNDHNKEYLLKCNKIKGNIIKYGLTEDRITEFLFARRQVQLNPNFMHYSRLKKICKIS